MHYADYQIVLDIRETVSSRIINAKRFDSGRKLYIRLTDGTVPYTPPENTTGVLTARKPDGNLVYNDCTMEKGVLCCPVTEQLTAVPGLVSCEVKLFDLGRQQLTCALFYLAVEETVFEERDIPGSFSEYGFIGALEQTAETALAQVTQAQALAQSAAAEAGEAVSAANQALTHASTAIEGAQEAARQANAAAQEASQFSQKADNALETAQKAEQKADMLREVVSGFHAILAAAEGSRIQLSDSAEAPVQSLKLTGKTTQSGIPTPAAPIPLVRPGDSGTLTVMAVGGRNLFDPGAYMTSAVNTTLQGDVFTTTFADGSLYLNKYTGQNPVVTPPGDYTLTLVPVSETLNLYVFIYDAQTKERSHLLKVSQEERVFSFSLTRSSIISFGGGTVNGTFSYRVQLEQGLTPTDYEPYQGTRLTVSTPNGLCGIPVASGGNHTDASGQQWLCDQVDLHKGVLVKHLAKYTLSSGMDIRSWTNGAAQIGILIYGVAYDDSLRDEAHAMCSHYLTAPNSVSDAAHIGIRCLGDGTRLYLRNLENVTTVEQWKAYFDQQSAKGTPVELVLPLAEPQETALSPSELAQYRKLYTQYQNTTVLADGADIEMTYLADTKTYIDNKFEALAFAMLRN